MVFSAPAPGYGSAPLDMRPTLVESWIRTPVPTSNMPARPIFKQALDLGQAQPNLGHTPRPRSCTRLDAGLFLSEG